MSPLKGQEIKRVDVAINISFLTERKEHGLKTSLRTKPVMSLLTPYRVLDLTGPLGFLTGKIFGDLGADVIKVEPPSGDPARRQRPFLNNGNGSPQSLYWLACNANKRGITLDRQSK